MLKAKKVLMKEMLAWEK